ncbi:MAG: alkene reductase, partial [Pseudomonadota bacterium]
VSPQGVGYPATPGIHSSEQVAGWRTVTDAVHAAGGRMFLQLWHVGRISHPSLQPTGTLPVAPSAIRPEGEAVTYEGMQQFVTPRALETDEVPGIIEQFRAGAQNAKEAGFDGVEIHSANGYLIDQFLRDGSNQRTDRYGGSRENRARLLIEITEAVCGVWGGGRVGVRFSPGGGFNDMRDSDPHATFTFAAEQLNSFGLSYLHVIETIESVETFDFSTLRSAFRGNYMANAGYDLARANAAIASGAADLVSFGTLFLANPDLPARFAAGADLNSPDVERFYGGNEKGYTDYTLMS